MAFAVPSASNALALAVQLTQSTIKQTRSAMNIFQPRRPPPAVANAHANRESAWQRERILKQRADRLKAGPFQPVQSAQLEAPAGTFAARQAQRELYERALHGVGGANGGGGHGSGEGKSIPTLAGLFQ